MTRISNYEELLAEKYRLQQKLILQKEEIRSEIRSIKESIEPVLKILSFIGVLKPKDSKTSTSLLKLGATAGLGFIAQKTLTSKVGLLAKLAAPFLVNGSVGIF